MTCLSLLGCTTINTHHIQKVNSNISDVPNLVRVHGNAGSKEVSAFINYYRNDGFKTTIQEDANSSSNQKIEYFSSPGDYSIKWGELNLGGEIALTYNDRFEVFINSVHSFFEGYWNQSYALGTGISLPFPMAAITFSPVAGFKSNEISYTDSVIAKISGINGVRDTVFIQRESGLKINFFTGLGLSAYPKLKLFQKDVIPFVGYQFIKMFLKENQITSEVLEIYNSSWTVGVKFGIMNPFSMSLSLTAAETYNRNNSDENIKIGSTIYLKN
jgi:hypothetical protein